MPERQRPCILNIEDDNDIARVVRTLLERSGYRVVSVADGREGLRSFHEERPDLVILDLGLPTLDGWTLIERVRDLSSAPILVLTALDAETDKVRGLRAGADDYITKPFGNSELVARVEALLRRRPTTRTAAIVNASAAQRLVPPPQAAQEERPRTPRLVIEHGVEVDFGAHVVRAGGKAVDLTPTEFRLLETLMNHRGQVLSPEQLLQLAWRDPTATGPDRVKFAMLRLRRKLGWDSGPNNPIETVRGFGYRYRPPNG
ncbi:MAG: response regulator transcription factor [Acidimicrobiales bacterium]